VDDRGLTFSAPEGVVLDVIFDGRRVWSIAADDHPASPSGTRRADWPDPMRKMLDGRTRVELTEHVTGQTLGEIDASFGSGKGRVSIVNSAGHPVVMTKWGRFGRPFADTERSVVEGYLDQVEEVLAVLRDECGLPAFLSFGSLLGAVREGKLIGHDVDVDLGYLSAYTHPADVMRESFRVERALKEKGWITRRGNGGFIGLTFKQNDGTKRNLDVFTAFLCQGRLFQVHDVGTEADESAVLPLGVVDFEGRPMPVPAKPEVFLEAAYGPDWRIPNPAFSFSTAKQVKRRITGWFGGLRRKRDYWARFYSTQGHLVPSEPSSFARWVAQRETPGLIVDVGCGNGRDLAFFAEEDFDITGLDMLPWVSTRLLGPTVRPGTPSVHQCNLESLRDTLAAGARLAHGPEVSAVYARFLLHDLTDSARDNFWRLTAMSLSRGGRCYLEFRTPDDVGLPKAFDDREHSHIDPDQVVAEARSHGARVVHREAGRGLAPFGLEDPHLCRLILDWSR